MRYLEEKKMARNELTPEQDVTTREFLVEVALAENAFSEHPALKRTLIGYCYKLLGYQRLPDGRFISEDINVKYKLGGTISFANYPDEWEKDYQNALMKAGKGESNAKQEKFTFDDNSTNETDSGEPTKDTPLWKTLFSKDI
jgi:hypothetical protein